MTYEEFQEYVRAKCFYETIYNDSDGREILIIRMLDAYALMMEFKPEKSLQEPVAWLVTYGGLTHVAYTQPTQVVDTHYQPLYKSPKHTWVGLTDEEMETLYYGNADSYGTERNFGRAVEAALKEKNGG